MSHRAITESIAYLNSTRSPRSPQAASKEKVNVKLLTIQIGKKIRKSLLDVLA